MKSLFLLGILLFLLAAKNAFAYLDPGTGSYLIQILIGAALGGAYLLKTFWKQVSGGVKKIFGRLFKGK